MKYIKNIKKLKNHEEYLQRIDGKYIDYNFQGVNDSIENIEDKKSRY